VSRGDRRVDYLTVDSVQEGVGVSQVLPYVLGLADRGWQLRLHTLERRRPDPSTETLLRDAGVRWTAHAFGRQGPAGGLGRVARTVGAVSRRGLVHARSDLSAAADAVWVRTEEVLAVEIDPRTNEVAQRIGPPSGSGGVAITDDAVWFSAHDVHAVWRLPTT